MPPRHAFPPLSLHPVPACALLPSTVASTNLILVDFFCLLYPLDMCEMGMHLSKFRIHKFIYLYYILLTIISWEILQIYMIDT